MTCPKDLLFGALIVLLIGVSVFMLMHNTDTEPEKVYIDVDSSKEVMDSLRPSQMEPTEKPFHKRN